MIETMTRKVAPKDEQKTINTMANFGWQVKSSQEINTVDSHLETRNDTLYSVTTKENYVKLLFQRNTEMKNYAQLVQLERQYAAIVNAQPKLGLNYLLTKKILFALIPVIGLFIALYFVFKNYFGDVKAWGTKYQQTAPTILSTARSLL